MQWLNQPKKIFVCCLIYLVCHLAFYDTVTNLYSLIKGQQHLAEMRQQDLLDIKKIEQQIELVKDPSYLERQAVDHFDLVGENDLLFVFPDGEDPET